MPIFKNISLKPGHTFDFWDKTGWYNREEKEYTYFWRQTTTRPGFDDSVYRKSVQNGRPVNCHEPTPTLIGQPNGGGDNHDPMNV